MPFRATTDCLAKAFSAVQAEALNLKNYATAQSAAMAAGSVSANGVREVYQKCVTAKAQFATAAALPGMQQYAKDQFNDQTYDVGAAFTAMQNAIQAVIDWITANYPVDATGYLLTEKFGAGGFAVRSFTPAQTAGLQTVLNNLAATIS